jgi:hypothetical protein
LTKDPPYLLHSDNGREKVTVYRLDPIPTTLSNPRWKLSHVRESVWVIAERPDEARQKVVLATTEFMPMVPGRPILVSPWYDDALVICVADTSRTDVPDRLDYSCGAAGRKFHCFDNSHGQTHRQRRGLPILKEMLRWPRELPV